MNLYQGYITRMSSRFQFLLNRPCWFGSLIILLILCTTILGQPSGGPYGPIQQKYKLPKVDGKIYYVAADGVAKQSGESLAKPTTLESAIQKVVTGDAIIMRGGTYRTGNLMVNQGITIQPFEDEQPIVKGTLIATEWENLGNGLWITKWNHLFPSKPADWWQRKREGKKIPQHRFNDDMVFVNGKFLQSAGWEGEVNENSFYIDYENQRVYIGIDPKDKLVEITVHNIALMRTTKECHGKKSDKKGFTIRGITFTQYAYRALEIEGTEPEGISPETNHGKEVVGTTFENCTISYCSRVAGYFRGDKMTFRNCKISDTSTEGIYIIGSNDVLLEKNIITRNNIENITGYYPAAVKIFNQSYRVTCNDNLVIEHPNSNGIWYDVGNVDGVFINNWIEGVGRIDRPMATDKLWPSDNGFFFEISKGVICAGNVFVNCDHGLMILNASNAYIYNNTFVNSMACIGRNARKPAGDLFGWHSSTGPDVNEREGQIFVNNLLTGDKNYNKPLLFIWQPAAMCKELNKPQLKQIDNNVYVRMGNYKNDPLILWSPAENESCQIGFVGLDDFRKLWPQFESNSSLLINYNGPLFKSMELENYELLPAFAKSESGAELPEHLTKLLGRSKKENGSVGAYPSK